MPERRSALRRGRIVWAAVRDRNGFVKRRPVIILTPTEQIQPEVGSLEVMAITTSYRHPPPADHVELPWHPRGNPTTKLNKRSAAVVNWLASIVIDDIEGFGADVPAKLMIEILNRLKNEK